MLNSPTVFCALPSNAEAATKKYTRQDRYSLNEKHEMYLLRIKKPYPNIQSGYGFDFK